MYISTSGAIAFPVVSDISCYLSPAGEVVPGEAIRLGGATASSQCWLAEDQGDSGTGGGTSEVPGSQEPGARSKERCC